MTGGLKRNSILLLTFLLGALSCSEKISLRDSLESGLRAGINELTLKFDGTERKLLIHLPGNFDRSKSYPLVFSFHGAGRYCEDWVKFFGREIDNRQVVGVYLQGVRHRWNDSFGGGEVNDVAFCESLIDRLSSVLNVDQERIFAVGWSLGGMFTLKLGRLSERFQSVACISGSFYGNPKFPEGKNLPSLLMLHGRGDPVIPFDGGIAWHGGNFEPVLETARLWAAHSGCHSEPEFGLPGDNIETYDYEGCTGAGRVKVLVFNNRGHHIFWEIDDLGNTVLDFFLGD